MADLSVEKAVAKDGTITVTGAGFTRTTTKVYLDGKDTPFEVNSETELVLQGSGGAVYAVKGETTSATVNVEGGSASGGSEPYKTATPDHTPGDVTKDDTTADASVRDLSDAANSQSDPKQMTEERVSDRALTVQEQGIGPKDPYPVGNPADPTAPSSGPNQYGEQKIKDDDGTNVGSKEV